MDFLGRVQCRLEDEGIAKTIKYGVYVGYYGLHNLFRDTFFDLRYSGRLLSGNHRTQYKHLGSNDVYHTDYSVMPLIFRNIILTPDDVLVDVGCGKGRVINYWLSRNYRNRMVGLELDPDIAKRTAAQFTRWGNVRIISGDAIANLPEDGTVFYFYNPFSEDKVREFERHLAGMPVDCPVKVIYYNPKSIQVFRNDNWDIKPINFENDFGIKRWGRLNKYHDLAIITRKHSRVSNAPATSGL